MALRRSNEVFLLTLVDFLIQIIFFALFIFVVYQAMLKGPNAESYEPAEVTKAIETAGVSNLTELVDELSKLAPVTLKGFNSSLGDQLKQGDLERASEAIKAAGGAARLDDAMQQLAKQERGSGKPACITEMRDGERKPQMLATATGSASTITFVENTPQLQTLLAMHGLQFDRIRSLGLADFKRVFAPVIHRQPECRYTIVLRETTSLVNARDAAQQIFYVAVRR